MILTKLKHIVFLFAAFWAVKNGYAQTPDIVYITPQSYIIGTPIPPLVPSNNGGAVPATIFGQVTTFAGSGIAGRGDGAAIAATFTNPRGVAIDAAGNLYVADAGNNLIRKITPVGMVTTFAGSGIAGSADGQGISATFSEPSGIAVDKAGNVYVTDKRSNIIRKISPAGFVTTIAGKPGIQGATNAQGSAATFNSPLGIAVDAAGYIYVADYGNNMIRGIAPDGSVRTIAGSGLAGNGVTTDADKKGMAATFRGPAAIAVANDGTIYVGEDTYIRTIDTDGNVTTIAGGFFGGNLDGTFKAAQFNKPGGITIDAANTLFIGDSGYSTLRRMDIGGVVTTVAGSTGGFVNGTGAAARFNEPVGTAVDGQGNVYVADARNNVIRKVTTTGYTISPNLPAGLNFDGRTGTITGTPAEKLQATNYTVTAYNISGKSVFTLSIEVRASGLIRQTITFDPLIPKKEGDVDYNAGATSTNSSIPITYTSSDNQVATITDGKIHILGPGKATITAMQNGSIDYEAALPVSQELIVSAVPVVYKYPTVTPKAAPVILPLGTTGDLQVNPADIVTIIADPTETAPVVLLSNSSFNCSSIGMQTVTLTAGYGPDPANPLNAEFNEPTNLTMDAQGNLYISDLGNRSIRKLSDQGRVTTLAGSGSIGSMDGKSTVASFSRNLLSIANDANGNIFVCDVANMLIRKITPNGDVSTFAAPALMAANGGKAFAAEAITVDKANNIYAADKTRILKISADGKTVSVFAGNALAKNVDGPGAAAGFSGITGLTFDAKGDMYVTTRDNNYINTVKKVTPDGMVTTIYTVTASSVNFTRLVVDSKGNIFIASSDNKIYKISASAEFSIFAGSVEGDKDGTGSSALFHNPQGIAIDRADNLYIADSDNHKIKKITPGGIVTAIAGNGEPGRVDNTSVSNARNTPIPVIITSPVIITTAYTDVTLPIAGSCLATMPDYAQDAKAASFCTADITISQSPAAGTPLIIGQATTVTLTADDGLSVYDRATVSFKVTAALMASPSISITPLIINTCSGAAITFKATAENAGKNPVYQWKVNGTPTYSGGPDYLTGMLVTGDKVTCTVTNTDGCSPVSSAPSAAAIITVNAAINPVVTISASVPGAVCPGTRVTFTALPINIISGAPKSFQWKVNNVPAGSDSPVFSTTALTNGDQVSCTLTSSGTCVVEPVAQSNVIIADIKTEAECAITISNTFTPNGDGVNDLWELPVLQSYPGCNVLIYNRYGKLVYQSTGYSKPWDGTYQGSGLATSTYYYMIDLKTGKPPLAGSVTIIR